MMVRVEYIGYGAIAGVKMHWLASNYDGLMERQLGDTQTTARDMQTCLQEENCGCTNFFNTMASCDNEQKNVHL